jgi:hypothetical protein
MGFSYNGQSGSTSIPDVTVATFADLPTTRPDGYLVEVTAESGLSADTVVQWDDGAGVWLLVSTSCAYSARAAAQWASPAGEWYSSGGVTVQTAAGAYVTDTTHDAIYRWSSAVSYFVPPEAYEGSPAISAQPIYGDSATPTGWTVTLTPGTGTATCTTNGTQLVLDTEVSTTTFADARITSDTDSSLSNTGNSYSSGLFQAVMTLGGSGNTAIGWSSRATNGARGYDFGSYRTNASPTFAVGQWYNPTTGAGYTAQAAATEDIETAEVLVEEIRKAGRAMVRVAGGMWHDIDAATVRTTADKNWMLQAYAERASGPATGIVCELRVREYIAIRY